MIVKDIHNSKYQGCNVTTEAGDKLTMTRFYNEIWVRPSIWLNVSAYWSQQGFIDRQMDIGISIHSPLQYITLGRRLTSLGRPRHRKITL